MATVTGPDGQYRLEGLRTANYRIGAIPPISGTAQWAVKPVSLDSEAGKTTENFDLTASKGGLLDIDLTREGEVSPETLVRIAGAGAVVPCMLLTDKQGHISLRAEPGPWRVWDVLLPEYKFAEQPAAVQAKPDETVKLVVALVRRPQITGTVVDEKGKGVEGAIVHGLHLGVLAKTDANGHFEFTFPASALDESYKDQRAVFVQVGDLVAARMLLDKDNSPIDLKLSPGVTATGLVRDPSAKPVAGAKIEVTAFGGQWNFPLERKAVSDANGKYQMAHLPVGLQYRMAATREDYGNAAGSLSLTAAPTGAAEITTITMPPANLTVAGIVMDADGEIVGDANMTIVGQYIGMRQTKADSKGHFVFEKVTAGPVIVSADAQVNGQMLGGRVEARGGQQDVEVPLDRASAFKSDANALIGKPLPSLSEVGIDIPGKPLENKRILVLFWSLKHSGAVDSLRQLNDYTNDLAAQNVKVLAVLTSGENPSEAEKWLRQNRISITTGYLPVSTDSRAGRQLMRKWNMYNLPSMVLTDSKHVVQLQTSTMEDVLSAAGLPPPMLRGAPAGSPAPVTSGPAYRSIKTK